MGDDSHVGLDDLHVDAMLLLADDHRPPQLDVLTLVLGAVRRDGFVRLARTTPALRFGIWKHVKMSQLSDFRPIFVRPTVPVHLVVRVVQVIAVVRSVEVIDVDVKVVRRLAQIVLALVQREADAGGRQFLPLGAASLKGQRGGRH